MGDDTIQIKLKMDCCEAKVIIEREVHVQIEKGDWFEVGVCPKCGHGSTRNNNYEDPAAGEVIDI